MPGHDRRPAHAAPGLVIAWCLLGMVACELIYLYTDLAVFGVVSRGLVLALPIIGWRGLRLREFYLLGFCLALIGLNYLAGKPVIENSIEGLGRSGYFASFLILMALLREGAVTSDAVLEAGRYLTRQPAKRRFIALFGGSHFFAVLINLGALSLLAPIIQRGVRAQLPENAPLDDISEVRERRQLSAALRGFSWFLVWAPTAVTQAVLPTLMTGIDTARLILTGLCLALVMLAVSWTEDALRWRGFRRRLIAEGRLPLPTANAFPGLAFRNLGLISLALFGLSVGFSQLFHVSIVTGVMLTSPIVVSVWVLAQQRNNDTAVAAASQRLRQIGFESVPGYLRETVFLACAGFIGTMAAKLVLGPDVAAAIALADQPGWLVLLVLSVSVWVFGQVGLSPITMAVFLGSVVAELPGMPVDMTHAALAIAAGTAICTTGAPFASGAVLLGRATGYSAFTLTWRWNGVYTLVTIFTLALFYSVLTTV